MAAGASSSSTPVGGPTIKLSSGYDMPLLGFGTFRAEEGKVAEAVKIAIRNGIRHIDCAWIYENEEEIGRALAEVFEEGVCKREDLFVTSKLWNTHHEPEKVRLACEETLRCLGLEYLDMYLVHFPLAFKDCGVKAKSPGFELDEDGVVKMSGAPLHKTWEAMEGLVDVGLVRSIGVSNYEFLTFNDCLSYARIKPAVNQIEAHPYFACEWFVKYCKKCGVDIVAHTPLGGAAANAKWRGDAEVSLGPLDDPTITAIAKKYSKSPAQVCIRWAIDRGTVVIPKSTKEHRIKENFDVFDFKLTPEEVAAIHKVDKKQRSNKSGGAWGIKFKA